MYLGKRVNIKGALEDKMKVNKTKYIKDGFEM